MSRCKWSRCCRPPGPKGSKDCNRGGRPPPRTEAPLRRPRRPGRPYEPSCHSWLRRYSDVIDSRLEKGAGASDCLHPDHERAVLPRKIADVRRDTLKGCRLVRGCAELLEDALVPAFPGTDVHMKGIAR